jgi:DNA-binding MarR family transcriptional regulator
VQREINQASGKCGIGGFIMDKASPGKIDKIIIVKKEDPDINLLIIFDQSSSLLNTAVELELRHLRVTQPQVRILNMLSRENRPVTIDELVDWTFKEFNSVSTLINRMEKRGLIKKIKKNDDLKTYIVPTEKGNVLYHEQIAERSIHLIFSKISDEEKKQLYNILKKVRDITRNFLGLDFKPPFLP